MRGNRLLYCSQIITTEKGYNTFLLTAKIDDRDGRGKIRSRIGIEHRAEVFDENTNIESLIQNLTRRLIVY